MYGYNAGQPMAIPIYTVPYCVIWFDRVSGYRNVSMCFFFIVTFQHFTGHEYVVTVEGALGFAERSRVRERRASETAEHD